MMHEARGNHQTIGAIGDQFSHTYFSCARNAFECVYAYLYAHMTDIEAREKLQKAQALAEVAQEWYENAKKNETVCFFTNVPAMCLTKFTCTCVCVYVFIY
jgi:hypothetical protein